MAVGTTILTSPDGVTWTARNSGTTTNLNAVIWGGGQFAAVGRTILTSPDGVTWTSENAGTSHSLSGVASNGRQFVAVGEIILLRSSQGSAVGVFRDGDWFLDANGNGQWDGCQQDGGQDACLFNSFSQVGDLPVVGDWNGDGKAKMGLFRNGDWFLDANGNGQWEACGIDPCYFNSFGLPADLPVAGDWNGDGKTKIGVFHNGSWFLDNGNGQWDGCDVDRCHVEGFGMTGDLPVVGDWSGDGKVKVGAFRNGSWFLDSNGNGQWDGCGVDQCYVDGFGIAGDLPVVGDWNGDGKAKVGVFRIGSWYLDANGNGQWDGCGVDQCSVESFGITGDLPVAGKW